MPVNRARITGGLATLVAGVLVLGGCGQTGTGADAQDGSTVADVLARSPFSGDADDTATEPVSYGDLDPCALLTKAERDQLGLEGRARVKLGNALNGDRRHECNQSIPDVGSLSIELHESHSTVPKRPVDLRKEIALDRHRVVLERIPHGCWVRADAEWTVVVWMNSENRDLACDLAEQVTRMIEPRLP